MKHISEKYKHGDKDKAAIHGKHLKNENEAKGLLALFQTGLKDMYWSEKALIEELPKLIRHAAAPGLINALSVNLQTARNHVKRLETVFRSMNMRPEAKQSDVMKSLLHEAESIADKGSGPLRDAAVIAAIQKTEHYKIATYDTLCTFASTLGEHDALGLLEENILEEREADNTLSELIASGIHLEKAVEMRRK